jgi:diguanylate cyclase (GGDEF)-like protein
MGVSSATVPLMSRDITTGVLGFIKYGDREWTQAEVNALKAIAALLAQMQARIAAEERLRYLAYHDELTGLSNRRALLDHLTKRLSPGEHGPVAVLFLDLDRLKAMNDFLGHAAGDQFLQSVATRLQTQRCPGDLVARLGGDEFVVVLGPPTGSAEAECVAVSVQKLVNEPVRLDGEEVSRRVSIGVAVAHPGHCTVSGLLGQADQAVMSAKAQGGNGIVAFTEEMRAQNEVRTDIELHLRGAIHDDALVLHYQPEIDLRTGELLGAEALVRWNHPTRGLLQPDSFIGVAEATNLAGELGRWVLSTACAQLSKWQKEFSDLNLCLRINVSPAQLITLDFVTDVAQSLEKHSIDGRYLSLEITEHAVVGDIDRTLETLRRLKEIGVRVAIDDFGTGYSSLAQLKALPVDALKIDQSFVQDLGSNRDDLAIVRSIVSLAASFGLDTVAEGVATEIAARTLVELGCFRAQGYLISVPVPAEELLPMLHSGYIPLASLEG